LIRSTAPARICDNGGWTDTWFAGHGCVCNLAVEPGVELVVQVFDRRERQRQITFEMPDPLLEAAAVEIPVPGDMAVEISVRSDMPAGSATGTSAAVTVALLGALDHLRDGAMSPGEVAAAAHRVETERLGMQSGVQDQLAAAHGGALFIEVKKYPQAVVTQLELDPAFVAHLEDHLVLVYLGRPHSSSAVHDEVIAALQGDPAKAGVLEDLRAAAIVMRDALLNGSLIELGGAMTANTEAQASLHPALIGKDAHEVIELARSHGALGWKVNGAGGDGGSVTVLCDRRLADELVTMSGDHRVVPVRLAREGLRVRKTA